MARRVLTAALAVASMAFIMGGAPVDDYDGPARWESTTVTVAPELADSAAAWGETLTFKVTDDNPQIDVHTAALADDEGGEAQRTFRDGNYLASCKIAVRDNTDRAILTHEMGHCLGLSHSGVGPTNMHWFARDYQGGWSDTVTSADLYRLANLYTN